MASYEVGFPAEDSVGKAEKPVRWHGEDAVCDSHWEIKAGILHSSPVQLNPQTPCTKMLPLSGRPDETALLASFSECTRIDVSLNNLVVRARPMPQ